MVNFIRRFQRPLLTVLVIIVIVAFVVLFNMPSAKNGFAHSDAVAKIYGHSVSQLAVQKEEHRFELCAELQLTDVLFGLGGREAFGAIFGQQVTNAAVENYIWNTMVLRHEADALGITTTEDERAEAIKGMRRFQTNGAFDYPQLQALPQNRLSHRGLTQDDVELLVSDRDPPEQSARPSRDHGRAVAGGSARAIHRAQPEERGLVRPL